mmetsp:Transcript_8933/g.18611  ORF Transcript_8933/g.18611 Transcript_8933/m.18611 type:complete len:182 (-) Transcript_8933:441-986(-)
MRRGRGAVEEEEGSLDHGQFDRGGSVLRGYLSRRIHRRHPHIHGPTPPRPGVHTLLPPPRPPRLVVLRLLHHGRRRHTHGTKLATPHGSPSGLHAQSALVEIPPEFETVLRRQEEVAVFGECLQVFDGGGGGDLWDVRSECEDASALDGVFFRRNAVSSMVGCLHGLGTARARFFLRLLSS